MQMQTTTHSPRDLLSVPGVLTLARLPLAVAFILVARDPHRAVVVLALAAASDVLDGWYARRFRQVSAIGALADAVTDKIFVATVAATLLVQGSLGLLPVFLLGVRDLGEAGLALGLVRRRSAVVRPRMALPFGKATTALQIVTVVAALFRQPVVDVLAFATAAVGALAVAEYWAAERGRRQPAR